MDAIIISDIHIGGYNCQAKTICKFLEQLKHDKPKRLIINGDLFDSFSGRLSKWHWKVLTNLRKLSDELELVWVQGNHDKDGPTEMVSHLIGASFYGKLYTFKSGDKKVLCIHGDYWDKFITDRPVLTWMADMVYWFLQLIDRSFYLAKLAKKTSKTFLRNAELVEQGAMILAKKMKCEIVCCGHCHHPYIRKHGNYTYLNSGSWTEQPCSYISICDGEPKLEFFDI